MAQFDLHPYGSRPGGALYVVDVQNDLLRDLETRVVIPVYGVRPEQRLIRILQPTLEWAGEEYFLATSELAAVRRASLHPALGSVAHLRQQILAALDLLYTGF